MAQKNTVTGDLSLHYEGYGFVVPVGDQKGGADVFVPARHIGDALHGDLVVATVRPSRKGLFDGEIVKILERRLKQVVGRLEKQKGKWILLSDDKRVRQQMVLPSGPGEAQEGSVVVATIQEYPKGDVPMVGKVLRVLPKRGTLRSEIEFVIAKHQLPIAFPKEVEEEAQKIHNNPPVSPESENRKDLRHLPFVTIDGSDAKDFDDAICAERIADNQIRVWVAIADVSHYVRPGSAIDDEAYARATSTYFPGRVLPMLPEVLSNDLCSLVPNQDRLVLCCEMDLNRAGDVTRSELYPAVFQSHARLTYKIVKEILEDRNQEVRDSYSSLLPRLELLAEAARWLQEKKRKRGSLDFDLPEPEIVLDFTGGIDNIEKAERYFSHQLIEELMILANETVATFLTAHKAGCLYRIHDKPNPDKISHFHQIISLLGLKEKQSNLFFSQYLQKVIQHFKGHPEERLVNTLLLRSMSQAVYSTENVGHFGLASKCYCHFTSPIRRYPDLVVHRLIKQVLQKREKTPQKILKESAQHSSRMERRSMLAEREALSLHTAIFMKEHVGKTFPGVIAHVTKFGFFVELTDYYVEGLVPLATLQADKLKFDEKHLKFVGPQKRFAIGDRITVKVEEVNLEERKIYFKYLDTGKL
ncbi:MAG: ribonuclease R [Deltaproteobacteria bacterium]|nr:ribonuclease R [Deltaproteobacteria bacterium]